MSVWIGAECDGNREGERCSSRFLYRTEDVTRVFDMMRQAGYRRMGDVLSPDTHFVMADEHLCARTDHDEEKPDHG